MKAKASRALLCSMLLVVPGWTTPGSAQKTRTANFSVPAQGKVDVCALLTSADIERLQGEPVKETRPGSQPGGGMLISQCLFRTATFAKSVTLSLAAPDPGNTSALSPRKFWRQQFHFADADREKESAGHGSSKKSGPDGEKEMREPRTITGLGEEAYWVGNPVTGALYVLEGKFYLRISVGGVREESARIAETRALARAALKRLPAQKH